MKLKSFALPFLAMAGMMTGCTQDGFDLSSGEKTEVTFTAQIPQNVTRALADGTQAKKCIALSTMLRMRMPPYL